MEKCGDKPTGLVGGLQRGMVHKGQRRTKYGK
jgi:hypothetical protein